MAFKEISIDRLKFNPFTQDWKRMDADHGRDEKKSNTMTASWGGSRNHVGQDMWQLLYIRPQRYTKEFVDNSEYFTLFLSYRKKKASAECVWKSFRTRCGR